MAPPWSPVQAPDYAPFGEPCKDGEGASGYGMSGEDYSGLRNDTSNEDESDGSGNNEDGEENTCDTDHKSKNGDKSFPVWTCNVCGEKVVDNGVNVMIHLLNAYMTLDGKHDPEKILKLMEERAANCQESKAIIRVAITARKITIEERGNALDNGPLDARQPARITDDFVRKQLNEEVEKWRKFKEFKLLVKTLMTTYTRDILKWTSEALKEEFEEEMDEHMESSIDRVLAEVKEGALRTIDSFGL